jgi:hypothetical protein
VWSKDVDEYGFSSGISYNGIRVLQLNPGTVRNEECVNIVVDILNHNDGAYSALEIKLAEITAPFTCHHGVFSGNACPKCNRGDGIE